MIADDRRSRLESSQGTPDREPGRYLRQMRFRRWLHNHFVTPDAVYGLILYSALIGGVSNDDSSSFTVLFVAGTSLIIFWGAHVFAGTIAGHGVKEGREVPLRTAMRIAIGHSSGMLYASILPSLPLVVGIFHLVSTNTAVDVALYIAMVVLGLLGYNAFAERKASIALRVLGGVGTALFGLLMIILNVLVH